MDRIWSNMYVIFPPFLVLCILKYLGVVTNPALIEFEVRVDITDLTDYIYMFEASSTLIEQARLFCALITTCSSGVIPVCAFILLLH